MGNPATREAAAAALLPPEAHDRLITVFLRAAHTVSAYRSLLAEHRVTAADVADLSAFSELVPVLSKAETFDRFPIDELGPTPSAIDTATVLTGSGTAAPFSFGLGPRPEAMARVASSDAEFDTAFEVKTRTTLAINCLPMGIGFSSHVMTVATTSVREDMVIGLVQAFGRHYDQLLLIGEPLFLKRLTDAAERLSIDWGAYRVNVAVTGEPVGEHYRAYLSSCFRCDLNDPHSGRIMSSFDVAELGSHLGYETRATIALRRRGHVDPRFAEELLGTTTGQALPTIYAFDPHRTFLEILDSDANGYGRLTISLLDSECRIPLLRYQTGDIAALLDRGATSRLADAYDLHLPQELPPAMLVLRGPDDKPLPNGVHVAVYKDALYANSVVARAVSGALRLIAAPAGLEMHAQLLPGVLRSERLHDELLSALPPSVRPARLTLWEYRQFPYGMTLDYERKFTFYMPGELEPTPDPV